MWARKISLCMVVCRTVVASTDEDANTRRISAVMRTEMQPMTDEVDGAESVLVEVDSEAWANASAYPQYGAQQQYAGQGTYAQAAPAGPATPQVPADLQHEMNCGSPQFVTTCGGASWPQTTYSNPLNGKMEYIRGLCVCTSQTGCTDPVCTAGACQSNRLNAPCANGVSCIQQSGTGWQCWHPCNMKHQLSSYGKTQDLIANQIRQSGQCSQIFSPMGAQQRRPMGYQAQAPTETPLNGGLDLSYQEYPFFGKQVEASKSGAWQAGVANVLRALALSAISFPLLMQ